MHEVLQVLESADGVQRIAVLVHVMRALAPGGYQSTLVQRLREMCIATKSSAHIASEFSGVQLLLPSVQITWLVG